MRQYRILIWACLLLFVSGAFTFHAVAAPPEQEAITEDIQLEVLSAGFGGRFREDEWIPLLVRVSNQGADLEGQLIVRPETSGRGLAHTFSAPLNLPQGSRKTQFFYIQATSSAREIQLEVLDNDGFIVAREPVNLLSVNPLDQLYIFITRPEADSINLVNIAPAAHIGVQTNWIIEQLPDNPVALRAVDMILINNADTSALTARQLDALRAWIAWGGHLIVTGGPEWQGTAAGLLDMLPFEPQGSLNVENLDGLTQLTGYIEDDLNGATTIATGEVREDAQVLAQTDDDLPLVIRRSYGVGVVDYIVADLLLTPLRDWAGRDEMLLMLTSTRPPAPSWVQGVWDWDNAATAINIMPGRSILPDPTILLAFLVGYIILIAPVNYMVLNAINRREWAWVTTPVLIIIFTIISWTLGFNLRGDDVTLSRLTVVEVWPEDETARVQQLIGLLAPRRNTYTLSLAEQVDNDEYRPSTNRLLRVLPKHTSSPILSNSGTNLTIEERDGVFSAVDFSADGGIFTSFLADGYIDAPDISGNLVIEYVEATGENTEYVQVVRGSVRNDSNITLENPVLLVRGAAYALDGPLEPGDIVTFNGRQITLQPEGVPIPSAMEHTFGQTLSNLFTGISYREEESRVMTVMDIMGYAGYSEMINTRNRFVDDVAVQEQQRRQALLESIIFDQYGSRSRGNHIYLIGWASQTPQMLDTVIEDTNWSTSDTTLYIVQIPVEVVPAPNIDILVTPDQFTWLMRERSGGRESGPTNTYILPGGELIIQFTPIEGAVLNTVEQVDVFVQLAGGYGQQANLELWNWQTGEWVDYGLPTRTSSTRVRTPSAHLGPQNTVRIRLTLRQEASQLNIHNLTITQQGRF